MSASEGNRMRPRKPSTDRAPAYPRQDARVRRTGIATALDSLPDMDRLVLSLYLLEGLSTLEIAGALKLTTREVEQYRKSALAAIARGLGSQVSERKAA